MFNIYSYRGSDVFVAARFFQGVCTDVLAHVTGCGDAVFASLLLGKISTLGHAPVLVDEIRAVMSQA